MHSPTTPLLTALVVAATLSIVSSGCSDDTAPPQDPPDASVNPFDVSTQDAQTQDTDLSDALTDPTDDTLPDVPPSSVPTSISIRFERHTDSNKLDLLIDLANASDERILDGHRILVSIDNDPSAGTLSDPQPDPQETTTRLTFTPSRTGRVTFIARAPDLDLVATRVALILSEVHPDWNQPEPVPGLVNTRGWEDGPSISDDGQHLVLQYLPVPLDCVLSQDPNDPTCTRAIGPMEGPERPNMPGTSRIDPQDASITHGCPSLGVPELPIPVPPNTLYIFTRQPDGSFANPRPLFFSGADGCISAFGAHLLSGDLDQDPSTPTQHRLLYALDNPLDNSTQDTRADLFLSPDLNLNNPEPLGRFVILQNNARLEHPATPLLTSTPQQGNPHTLPPSDSSSGPHLLFFDDEAQRKDLFVSSSTTSFLSNPTPTLSEPTPLPEIINSPDDEESQPFYTGTHLIFRRGLTLLISSTSPPPNLNPSQPTTLLAGDPTATTPGTVLGVGEPSVALYEGRQELYFVFVEIAPDQTFNLDVARVSKRSTQ